MHNPNLPPLKINKKLAACFECWDLEKRAIPLTDSQVTQHFAQIPNQYFTSWIRLANAWTDSPSCLDTGGSQLEDREHI